MEFPENVPPKNIFNFFDLILLSIFLSTAIIPIGRPPANDFPKTERLGLNLNLDWNEFLLSLKPVIISSKKMIILFFFA